MSIYLAQGLRAFWGMMLGIFLSSLAQAHVVLDSPNGGVEEVFEGGSLVTVEWHVHVAHATENWDLWYSTVSDLGPWEVIALDQPKGDISTGAMHTFDWSIPNINATAAWVRIIQDNELGETDYEDTSNASFEIVANLGGGDFTGDGHVDAVDLASWETGYGIGSGAVSGDGDADLDKDVDGADFLAWQGDYVAPVNFSAALAVPEPTTAVLLLTGAVFVFWQQRLA